jgi:threonine aldolase
MSHMGRRDFMKLGGVMAAAGMQAPISTSVAQTDKLQRLQQAVNFIYDGSYLSPLEYSHLLSQLAEDGKIAPDNYSNGGIVEELEHKFAALLGKESAVFMPTGTRANQIALRQLAGSHTKVIVQAESHIYNDSGDCAQTLSGLNLIPLAPGQAGFSLEAVQEVIAKARTGRVATQVGVIAIESPVRRKDDAMFGYGEMQRICAFARDAGIGLHFDGARIFVESVHTGIPPAQYAALFDTVYVSLYKCFNAAAGAILAGSRAFTQNLYHVRRMFGAGLPWVWPYAAVALQFVDDFIEEYTTALQTAETLFQLLENQRSFRIEKIPNGTHIVKLHVSGIELDQFRTELQQRNIHLPHAQPSWGGFALKLNPSLNRTSAQELADTFLAAV